MIATKLKTCFQHAANSFGGHLGNPAVASRQRGEWKKGKAKGAGFSQEQEVGGVAAVLFADGCLLVVGPQTVLYPGCETFIAKIAANKFDIKPEQIFVAYYRMEEPPVVSFDKFGNTSKQEELLSEAIQLLSQNIKHIAITGPANLCTKNSGEELVISKGFLTGVEVVSKIAVVDILHQNNLLLVEASTTKGNYCCAINFPAPGCIVHYLEIMVNAATGKWKVNRLVSVIDAGEILDVAVMASQLKNTLLLELPTFLPGYAVAASMEFTTDAENDKQVNSIFGDLPSIEIIFINPKDVNDEKPSADIVEITGLYLDSFSIALNNAFANATGKHFPNTYLTKSKSLVQESKSYRLPKKVTAF